MHAIIDVFNGQTIAKYSQVVYKLAKNPEMMHSNWPDHTWLISCASHTMKRVTVSLKKMKIANHNYTYAAFSFSLLLNCTTLNQASEHFKNICTVFLTPSLTPSVTISKAKLREALQNRPETLAAMTKLYRDAQLSFDVDNYDSPSTTSVNDFEIDEKDDDDSDNDGHSDGDDDNSGVEGDNAGEPSNFTNEFKPDNIKQCSPFKDHFDNIATSIDIPSSEDYGENNFCFPSFIKYL